MFLDADFIWKTTFSFQFNIKERMGQNDFTTSSCLILSTLECGLVLTMKPEPCLRWTKYVLIFILTWSAFTTTNNYSQLLR